MLTRLENGAEEEAEIVTRWEMGAETEAEGAYTVENGAEEEVWSAVEYILYNDSNCTISDGVVTMKFSWSANSGNSGAFYISGDFKAGESYDIRLYYESTVSISLPVDGYFVGDTAHETYGSLSMVNGTASSAIITPTKDVDRIRFYYGVGSASGGSYEGTFSNITVNGKKCTNE